MKYEKAIVARSAFLHIIIVERKMYGGRQYRKCPQEGVAAQTISTHPFTDFTFLWFGSLMREWKLKKGLLGNRSLSPDRTCLFHIVLLRQGELLIGWVEDLKLFQIWEGRQQFVLKEADSNPHFHGRISRLDRYLEDGSHEDGESRQDEHKDTGDSLFPGLEDKRKHAWLIFH